MTPSTATGLDRYRRRTGRQRPEAIVIERPVRNPEMPAIFYVTAGTVRGVLIDDGSDVAVAAFSH